jgi:RNA polymerase sigma-70 factor (ECF subfamily)
MDDAELARAAAARDPRAAALVWDRYSTMVRGILRRSLGPSNDVEDMVQDVFLGFFRKIEDLRDPSALKSFLIGITLRTAGSALRKRRVRRWLSLTPTGSLPDTDPTVPNPEARRALAKLYEVLDQIDDRSRLAFVLRHFEGHELTEVAEELGCSLATTKRCLARAQERVHAMVKREPLLAAYVTASKDREVADAAWNE